MSKFGDLGKSNQEQAVAAWVNYLNQLRLDQLLATYKQQDINLRDALNSLSEAMSRISGEIITKDRGHLRGMHGFIAEVAETGIGNARSQIRGNGEIYDWLNNNGPADLLRNGIPIQQKFVISDNRFGLGAIREHFGRYPDFLVEGGRYQLPRDQYEALKQLYLMPTEEAHKFLSRSGDGPSLKDWIKVQEFFRQGDAPFDAIEPSQLTYSEVQRETITSTIKAEEESIRGTDKAQRDKAHQASKPSLSEGAKATAMAAAVEGSRASVAAVVAKRREGRALRDFTSEDWLEIAEETGIGTLRGGVRGASVYTLTNYTATPAAVASSIVTTGFGIADQANKFRQGDLDELEFIENAELLALDTAVGALSSFVGQAVIPVPVLGAVIGNTVATIMYSTVSSSLSQYEAALLERYCAEQGALDAELAEEYSELIKQLNASLETYFDVLDQAFSPDIETALLGSVQLALELDVAADEILDSKDKAMSYFLD